MTGPQLADCLEPATVHGSPCSRYHDHWLRKFHGNLGTTIRRLYDTEDLIQSAITDAMNDIGGLENEGAFYTWVTSIIRHKIAMRRRRLIREVPANGRSARPLLPPVREGRRLLGDGEVEILLGW